jgi:thioredoxin
MRIVELCLLLLTATLLLLAGCPPQAGPPPPSPGGAVEPPPPPPPAAPAVDNISWKTSLPDALAAAEAAGKPVVVDVWAEWCGPCHMLADESFPSAPVQALKDNFIWAKVDFDKHDDVAARYKVSSLPTILILKSNGQEVDRLVGFVPGPRLAGFLSQGLTKSRLLKPKD